MMLRQSHPMCPFLPILKARVKYYPSAPGGQKPPIKPTLFRKHINSKAPGGSSKGVLFLSLLASLQDYKQEGSEAFGETISTLPASHWWAPSDRKVLGRNLYIHLQLPWEWTIPVHEWGLKLFVVFNSFGGEKVKISASRTAVSGSP